MIRYASESRFANLCCDNPSIRLPVNRSKLSSILLTPWVLQFARTTRLTQTDALHSCDATVSQFSVIRPRNRTSCRSSRQGSATLSGPNWEPIPLAGRSESVQRALRYCDEVIRITVDYELSRDHAPRKLFTSTMIYSDAELWYRLIAMYCGLLT